MIQKIIASGICFAMILLTTGCERKDATPTGNSEANQTSQGIVELWTVLSPMHFEALGREFVQTEAGLGATFRVVDFPNEELLQETLIDKMAEGKGPDIIVTQGNWIANNNNKLYPHPYNETSNLTPSLFREIFVQSAAETLIKNEQIYGLPVGIDSLGLYYNKTHILDRLENRNLPGKTWLEFRKDAITLTKKDNSLSRFANSGAAIGRFDNTLYGPLLLENIMLQWGTDFFDPRFVSTLFHQTQATENGQRINVGETALDFFTSFADNRFQNYTWNEYLAADDELKDFKPFLLGQTSMMFATSQDYQKLSSAIASFEKQRLDPIAFEEIGVAALPQVEDPTLSPYRTVVGEVYGIAVPRTAQYPNAAWAFLKFAVDASRLQALYESSNLPSPLVELIPAQSQTPEIGIFSSQAKFAKANPMPIAKANFYDLMNDVVQQLNAQKIQVKGALNNPAQILNTYLKATSDLDKKLKE